MKKAILFGLFFLGSAGLADLKEPLHDASYVQALERIQAREAPAAKAKNVILFIGDGMSLATVSAARIFEGQALGLAGEEHFLSFEHFEYTAFSKTWNADSQVPDSAGTATAMLSGVKTNIGVLGVDASVERGDCEGLPEAVVATLLELAEDRGLKTGVVSTAELTHATPASAYAHTSERGWDSQAECGKDIASQLLDFAYGDGIEVALGGGRKAFVDRPDGRDLVAEWSLKHPQGTYVSNAEELAKAQSLPILGLFNDSHMNFEADRAHSSEPSLAEMTEHALNHLGGDEGFFLLVEAGRIDHAHHFGNAYRALVDTRAFAEAISVATRVTDSSETLILVTADHGHTMTIGGYPERGNPILGLVREAGEDDLARDRNGLPYTTLTYANGPGYRSNLERIEEGDAMSPEFQQPAAVNLFVETHSGEDVPVYATGPGAERVRGVMEQNELFHVMRMALFAGEAATSD